MALLIGQDSAHSPGRRLTTLERARLLGWLVLLALGITGVLVFRVPVSSGLSLEVGDISPRDIVAPRGITYMSEVLTERARQAAEAEVGVVYDPPNSSVARQQVSLAHQVLDRIASIRDDREWSDEEKRQALADLGEVELRQNSIEAVLTLTEKEWHQVEQEVVRVLGQSMRSVIRDVDLQDAKRRVPALLSFDLSDDQAAVVIDIVADLIRPNTFRNEERTAEERRKARESVQSVTSTLQLGQVIVRAGDRLTELQLEALQQIGLMEPATDWRFVGQVALSQVLLGLLVYLYVDGREPELGRNWRALGLLTVVSTAAALAARFMIPDHVLLQYVFPAAVLPILVCVLISPDLALLTALLPASFYVHLADGFQMELASYGFLGSLASVLVLARLERLKSFVWAGVLIAMTNAGVLVIYRVLSGNFDTMGLASLAAAAIVCAGLAAALGIVGYLLMGSAMGVITSPQLLELSQPTRPLLRELLVKAPGTYHHSIMVGNLAEQAAERINANAFLARVGAYYHDIGKIGRPYFYAENQTDGRNLHEHLDPRSSAEIIIGHVQEGVRMARRYRLPPAIVAFISEHHGRTRQEFFYNQAVELHGEENVDEHDFRYPGPRPQSKETAIVMLADACEAAVRAARPSSVDELSRLVERIVDDRFLEGELDECPLTVHDITTIKIAFVNVLQGVFHPRVQYPEGALAEERANCKSAQDSSSEAASESEAQASAEEVAIGDPQETGGVSEVSTDNGDERGGEDVPAGGQIAATSSDGADE